MPEEISTLRKANARQALRAAGLMAGRPADTALRQLAAFNESEIMALPQDVSEWAPLQVLTPGANFGLFYFMPDYDAPGDPNHPVR